MSDDDWTIEKNGEVRWQGILAHEYVPGEYTHPMRTEPDCRDCGEARQTPVHGSRPARLSGWMGRSR